MVEPSLDAHRKQTVVLTPIKQREEYMYELLAAVAATGRVFARGQTIAYVDRDERLQLINDGATLARLIGQLVNVIKVDSNGNSKAIDPPVGEGNFILSSLELLAKLPAIRFLAEVPVLDNDFQIVDPGYNSDSGIYYDGDPIAPTSFTPHLNGFLKTLCFKRPSDRTNYIGSLLTVFLGPRFAGGRPIIVFKGNQQGIGKTAAAQILAAINSRNSEILSITWQANDAELEKCIGALVQRSNFILLDNIEAKDGGVISSPSIERTVTLPTYNFRRIGTSKSITGENYLQFICTLNAGVFNSDLFTRSVFIPMDFQGDPTKRPIPTIGDPVDYVRRHRQEIIAELLGMIVAWQRRGCQTVEVPCRFRQWAALINGILVANGHYDFLTTYTLDAREADERQVVLEELALACPNEFKRPSEWLAESLRLGLLKDRLRGCTVRGQQTTVGTLLKGCVGREILPTDSDGQLTGIYRLDRRDDRNGSLYRFTSTQTSETADPSEMVPAAHAGTHGDGNGRAASNGRLQLPAG